MQGGELVFVRRNPCTEVLHLGLCLLYGGRVEPSVEHVINGVAVNGLLVLCADFEDPAAEGCLKEWGDGLLRKLLGGLDNLLFDPDRTRVTVVDWQTLAVGLPARDLAYFVATSLAPGERAEYERELVGVYHRALTGYQVNDYDAETCWQDYRLGMLQVPLITTLGFAFSAATERGDDMALAMLERGSRAIRELGTLDLLP